MLVAVRHLAVVHAVAVVDTEGKVDGERREPALAQHLGQVFDGVHCIVGQGAVHHQHDAVLQRLTVGNGELAI